MIKKYTVAILCVVIVLGKEKTFRVSEHLYTVKHLYLAECQVIIEQLYDDLTPCRLITSNCRQRLIVLAGSRLEVSGHVTEKLLTRSSRMVDGSKTSIENVPWQVSLMYTWGTLTTSFCGGSIISSNWVVTAGHCLRPIPIKPQPTPFVSAGADDFRNGSPHSIVEKIRHPLYEERQETTQVAIHDIALLRVAEPFEFDRTRQPIPLYVRSHATLSQIEATASGWGAVNIEADFFIPDLKSATMRITTVSKCNAFLSTVYNSSTLPTGQICAEASSGRTCGGDSGGPLTVNNTLVGIASWQFGDACTNDYPSVFTEVARYRYWISEVTSI